MNRRWAVPRRLRRPCQGNTRSIEQGRFPWSPRCLAATKRNREQADQGQPHQPKRDGPRQYQIGNLKTPCHEACPTITPNRYQRLGRRRAKRTMKARQPWWLDRDRAAHPAPRPRSWRAMARGRPRTGEPSGSPSQPGEDAPGDDALVMSWSRPGPVVVMSW